MLNDSTDDQYVFDGELQTLAEQSYRQLNRVHLCLRSPIDSAPGFRVCSLGRVCPRSGPMFYLERYRGVHHVMQDMRVATMEGFLSHRRTE